MTKTSITLRADMLARCARSHIVAEAVLGTRYATQVQRLALRAVQDGSQAVKLELRGTTVVASVVGGGVVERGHHT